MISETPIPTSDFADAPTVSTAPVEAVKAARYHAAKKGLGMYSIYPYQVTGIGQKTGRQRKRIYQGQSALAARQAAERDGTIVDEIVRLEPDPATAEQIVLAKQLGLNFPDNINKVDISALISFTTHRDRSPSATLLAQAQHYGIDISPYAGKKLIFNAIHSGLLETERHHDLVAWYVFRVYRSLVGGAQDASIMHPQDATIDEIASELVNDPRVINSIAKQEGQKFIWFGRWTAPDGKSHNGGSIRTTAFDKASRKLCERLNLTVPESCRPLPTKPASGKVKKQQPAPASTSIIQQQNQVEPPKKSTNPWVVGVFCVLLFIAFIALGA